MASERHTSSPGAGGKLSELVKTQQLLMCIKEQVRSDLIEEFAEEARFATNALRLGTNKKCSVMAKPGDVVQLRTQNTFEVGVLTRLLTVRGSRGIYVINVQTMLQSPFFDNIPSFYGIMGQKSCDNSKILTLCQKNMA